MKTSTVIITIALIAAGGLFVAKKLFKDEPTPEQPKSDKKDTPATEPSKTSNKNIQPFAMTQTQYEKNAGISNTAFTGLNYVSQGQGVSFGSGRFLLDLSSIPKS